MLDIIVRKEKNEGPHHLIVLMHENVTMIDVTWKLDQVSLRNSKVGIGLHGRVGITVRCPTYTNYKHSIFVNKSRIFPSSLMR